MRKKPTPRRCRRPPFPSSAICGCWPAPRFVRRRNQLGSCRPTPGRAKTAPACYRSPYGVDLDSEWRDRAGLNGCGPAEPSYLKKRTKGNTETAISGDTRADWSDAFPVVPCLEVEYVWHASKFTREVLDGLLRIGFLHHQQILWGPNSSY